MTTKNVQIKSIAAPTSNAGNMIPGMIGTRGEAYDEDLYYGGDMIESHSETGMIQTTPSYRYFFGGGYVDINKTMMRYQPTYYYYSKDHLGNVRSVVKANDGSGATEVQRTHYYPFGGVMGIPYINHGDNHSTKTIRDQAIFDPTEKPSYR